MPIKEQSFNRDSKKKNKQTNTDLHGGERAQRDIHQTQKSKARHQQPKQHPYATSERAACTTGCRGRWRRRWRRRQSRRLSRRPMGARRRGFRGRGVRGRSRSVGFRRWIRRRFEKTKTIFEWAFAWDELGFGFHRRRWASRSGGDHTRRALSLDEGEGFLWQLEMMMMLVMLSLMLRFRRSLYSILVEEDGWELNTYRECWWKVEMGNGIRWDGKWDREGRGQIDHA